MKKKQEIIDDLKFVIKRIKEDEYEEAEELIEVLEHIVDESEIK